MYLYIVPSNTVLAALADPTRRRIFERLRHGSETVGNLAKFARISQPAVSQHLQRLRRARLVADHRLGTRRLYYATPEGLKALRRYVESLWNDVLVAYATADITTQEGAK